MIALFCLQQSLSVPHQEGQAPATGGLQPIQEDPLPKQGSLVNSGHVCINFGAEIQSNIPKLMHTWPVTTGDPCFFAFSPCFPWVGCKPQVAGAYLNWCGTKGLCWKQNEDYELIRHLSTHTFLLKTVSLVG